jgi:hypothetical protein
MEDGGSGAVHDPATRLAVNDDVVDAWDAVHDTLARLPGWEAARPVYNDGERLWIVTAFHTGHVRVGQRARSWRLAG